MSAGVFAVLAACGGSGAASTAPMPQDVGASEPVAANGPVATNEVVGPSPTDGAAQDGAPENVETVPPLTDAETATVIAFVEELIEIAEHPSAPRLLAARTDWAFVENVEAAVGRPPPQSFERRWSYQLGRALSLDCPARPWTVAVFTRGVVDGHFEAPPSDDTTPTQERRAREELSRGLARSLVVSSPCEPVNDPPGFDLLLRREGDGGLAVRGFRRREPMHPLRL